MDDDWGNVHEGDTGHCKDYTEMVKCYMKVTCSLGSNGLKETCLEGGMKDMNGKQAC